MRLKLFVAESLKRIKTKIWRIRIRIFWRFQCREQVKHLFSSQLEISHVLNRTTPKIQHINRGPQFCLCIENSSLVCNAFVKVTKPNIWILDYFFEKNMVYGRKDCIEFVSIKNTNSLLAHSVNINCGKLVYLQCTDLVYWYIRDSGTTKIFVVYEYFLGKYQLSIFLCLLFAEKINYLLVNQQKNSQLKLVLRTWKKSKKNFVKKNIRRSRNFGGLDATNELNIFNIFFIFQTKEICSDILGYILKVILLVTLGLKLYIPCTINIWKKVLTKANGLVSGRLACTSSKTEILNKIGI
jgi:hypothetical protein